MRRLRRPGTWDLEYLCTLRNLLGSCRRTVFVYKYITPPGTIHYAHSPPGGERGPLAGPRSRSSLISLAGKRISTVAVNR